SREFREVVGRVQYFGSFFPFALIHCIIEIWDQIPQRTTTVTKGDATIHASGPLVFQFLFFKGKGKLLIIFGSFGNIQVSFHLSAVFHKSRNFSHGQYYKVCSFSCSNRKSACRNSSGNTFMNFGRYPSQSSKILWAKGLRVAL